MLRSSHLAAGLAALLSDEVEAAGVELDGVDGAAGAVAELEDRESVE